MTESNTTLSDIYNEGSHFPSWLVNQFSKAEKNDQPVIEARMHPKMHRLYQHWVPLLDWSQDGSTLWGARVAKDLNVPEDLVELTIKELDE